MIKQTQIFPNIMIGYTIAWPVLGATILDLGIRFALPDLVEFRYDLYLFLGLCAFQFLPGLFAGMYLARRAVKRMPICLIHYYIYTLLGALTLPVIIFDWLRIMNHTNRYDTVYGSLSFAASFALTSLIMTAVACICALLFRLTARRWLENTAFALKFEKHSSVPIGS